MDSEEGVGEEEAEAEEEGEVVVEEVVSSPEDHQEDRRTITTMAEGLLHTFLLMAIGDHQEGLLRMNIMVEGHHLMNMAIGDHQEGHHLMNTMVEGLLHPLIITAIGENPTVEVHGDS